MASLYETMKAQGVPPSLKFGPTKETWHERKKLPQKRNFGDPVTQSEGYSMECQYRAN